MIKTIEWKENAVVMLDQRLLPRQEIYCTYTNSHDVADAIRKMVVRGAPAIGVAAAMGVALGAQNAEASTIAELDPQLEAICVEIAGARPTAVNLFWAVDRMRNVYQRARAGSVQNARAALIREAMEMHAEDIRVNRAMGKWGEPLIPEGARILTHCNAGALATAGYGTALGVIRAAVEAGKKVSVYADETRPFLQGARLTAWELQHDHIPVTVITDGMAGHFMLRGGIDCVIVGADRIAANGDVANKIGTYSVAVLAKENGIPFYVAAPTSTFDLTLPDGNGIPIEERDGNEVRTFHGIPVTSDETVVANPAFDVTPNRYVTAIITEKGVARAPYQTSLAALAGK
jgi:methylthioribose-1-phosphate isomerase